MKNADCYNFYYFLLQIIVCLCFSLSLSLSIYIYIYTHTHTHALRVHSMNHSPAVYIEQIDTNMTELLARQEIV